MTTVALFHSALGVRPGITDAADRLRAAGHDVVVVDQYGGRSFDDYAEAGAHVEAVGFPALMATALDGVAALPDGFVAAGFSNGAGMAEYVATRRRVAGLLLFSGALPLALLGDGVRWPAGVPAQLHHTTGDPLRRPEWTDQLLADARAGGGAVEVFEYPGTGHLFTDPGLPAEYDPEAAALLWDRALAFCRRVG
ncbi:dienelactone hydrolase family protein [Geodermatophilus marinus]|uniref:dienelactone hydrolase family protein n=1 Tax=Geodermatophilus sp. LHW52908 TaxID=2303986 RepID=UPI000E3E319F|nr:dienelactone hydrolase family protein [Geodermatophilus sp. LHW52908]RFU23430.1 dienelactone hydrolase [Geodermatophilus sp. LHW52908]